MATNYEKTICPLCGQTAKINRFALTTLNNESLHFCCQGCLSIYQLLHSNISPKKIIDQYNNNEEK
ncbi:MAG: metal-binding protein [Methylococcaceae bacterium]|nr:MAG: metal-binding protein [Methylococcaceae bacterium]